VIAWKVVIKKMFLHLYIFNCMYVCDYTYAHTEAYVRLTSGVLVLDWREYGDAKDVAALMSACLRGTVALPTVTYADLVCCFLEDVHMYVCMFVLDLCVCYMFVCIMCMYVYKAGHLLICAVCLCISFGFMQSNYVYMLVNVYMKRSCSY
jgi:hypothetical protein